MSRRKKRQPDFSGKAAGFCQLSVHDDTAWCDVTDLIMMMRAFRLTPRSVDPIRLSFASGLMIRIGRSFSCG